MEKLELILPYLMTTTVLVLITVIIFRLFNYALQRKILEKGSLDEHAVQFLKAGTSTGRENLKWGLLLFFGGCGLLVMPSLPFDLDHSPIPYGIEAIFLSFGFIIYFLLNRKWKP